MQVIATKSDALPAIRAVEQIQPGEPKAVSCCRYANINLYVILLVLVSSEIGKVLEEWCSSPECWIYFAELVG